ncbi:hypothetical protein ACNOYE_02700 [Nannocystaceae bacterium ST9]
MNWARALSILLASSSIAACDPGGSGDDEGGSASEPCPATGAPLLPELPRVQPKYTDGCEDSTWASEVAAAEVAWTIELERGAQSSSMVVVPSNGGVVAISGRTARWVTSEGDVVNQRDLGTTPSWNRVRGLADGRLVVVGTTAGTPFYRVLDVTGSEIWLRLLDPNFGAPSLALDGTDLLLGNISFDNDFALRIQRWELTGSKQGELFLPGVDGDMFVRDGVGRYAVASNGGGDVRVFSSEGAPLGSLTVAPGEYPYVIQLVGADDGFYAAGGQPDPFVARIEVVGDQAELAWTYTLGDPSVEWEYANGLALLPSGGVVAVGGESKIRVVWPTSPLANSFQPFVLALDREGERLWGDRIGVPGQALAVEVGPEGEVYVGGSAQAGLPSEFGSATTATWLRRYDPS